MIQTFAFATDLDKSLEEINSNTLSLAFDPSERRDAQGRWTSGGAGKANKAGAGGKKKKKYKSIRNKEDRPVQTNETREHAKRLQKEKEILKRFYKSPTAISGKVEHGGESQHIGTTVATVAAEALIQKSIANSATRARKLADLNAARHFKQHERTTRKLQESLKKSDFARAKAQRIASRVTDSGAKTLAQLKAERVAKQAARVHSAGEAVKSAKVVGKSAEVLTTKAAQSVFNGGAKSAGSKVVGAKIANSIAKLPSKPILAEIVHEAQRVGKMTNAQRGAARLAAVASLPEKVSGYAVDAGKVIFGTVGLGLAGLTVPQLVVGAAAGYAVYRIHQHYKQKRLARQKALNAARKYKQTISSKEFRQFNKGKYSDNADFQDWKQQQLAVR